MRKFICIFFLFSLHLSFSQKIYSVQYKSQADVKIFVVEYKSQADKKIYFTEYKSNSDLTIFFVDYKSQAGWQDKSKKYFLY